jgi:diguanylate cyclase (GGDEF)-like protein
MTRIADHPQPRPPIMVIVTTEEWVALAIETLFAPRGYAVVRASTARQAFDLIRQVPPDVLVVSRDLRDRTGVELCRTLEENRVAARTIPKLLLGTSPWTREDRLEALKAGAWDVRHIPTDGEELFLRVDAWVQAKLAADLSRERGLLDQGTGLYNTAGLLKRMEEVAAGAGRHNRALACVIVALEGGEALEGDEATQGTDRRTHDAMMESLAGYLRESGRASDAIGRVSDTQFVVVAPDTDEEGALGLINRLRGVIAADVATESVRFGSFGVPRFRDASIAPTEMLIKAADALRMADSEAGQGEGSRDRLN